MIGSFINCNISLTCFFVCLPPPGPIDEFAIFKYVLDDVTVRPVLCGVTHACMRYGRKFNNKKTFCACNDIFIMTVDYKPISELKN